ncbi:MAG: hypothetical protein MUF61_02480 [archaeon]|jgi:hypothetical protein|nr:hypothetical protein [archaeon]
MKNRTHKTAKSKTSLFANRLPIFAAFAAILLSVLSLAYIVLNFTSSATTSHSISDIQAPQDTIKESNIEVYSDKIVIKVSNASLSAYAPTGSMTPLFNEGANGVRIVPLSEDEIAIGDIVSYQKGENLIVHRVIEKGTDEQGVYFIVKGDNNSEADGKIRFEEIKYKTIAILY